MSGPRVTTARGLARDVLGRIEGGGAYANLALGSALDASDLSDADRRFATDLVYGTTRMRRACDVLVDRFVTTPPDRSTRTLLRLGAYQLAYAGVPPHAAVGETVGLAPRRTRGFVNAVLRKVATHPVDEQNWPSTGARLSYPDWMVDRLGIELGDDAIGALERMNEPPPVTVRDDGYVQDTSSQWVAAAVEARPGDRVLDVCAAPGGKTTAIVRTGALVIAADRRASRARLVAENADRLGVDIPVVIADGTSSPFRESSFAVVLVDAPCSGLGALRRRADARWRISDPDIEHLAGLQRRLLDGSAPLVAPGGRIVYSVCTLTAQESIDHVPPAGFEIDPRPPDVGRWRAYGPGWRVLPQDADTDGMALVRYRRR
ncbi:MAG: transcription antitermination factor NusB [Acidimicrobiia bacterium]|nr:transcription antitermination factor NusB [Acidimicrobiia bacterium]